MTARRALGVCLATFLLPLFLVACGGNNGGGAPPPSPAPSPSPSPTSGNPCPASSTSSLPVVQRGAAAPSKTRGVFDSDPRGTLLETVWAHRAAVARRRLSPLRLGKASSASEVGDIVIVQDEGDLITQPNAFDLRLSGLHAVPNAAGGFDVARIDAAFRADIGDQVTLDDDDSVERTVPFAFRFFGRTESAAFVNSDGNITFGEADRSHAERNVARLLTGAPRVAPFLADLDPSVGGSVFVRAASDAFTATWCGVPVFDSTLQATLQTTLLPDGSVEMQYADAPAFTATDGVVGVSPGRSGLFAPLDLSTATTTASLAGGTSALGERFAAQPGLDLVSVVRTFYQAQPDDYDQLIVWTDTRLTFDAFAFEVNVANEVAGIGIDRFDNSAEFGSNGVLRSVVQMDDLGKFPDDPAAKFLGENTTLSVLGQEVGHRWLAFLRFSDHNRQVSDALLGRDGAHWSFFLNSDASVMEGNRIEDLGGGSFRTVAAVEKYSLLDQYAMGLVRDINVPPFFYVESPANVQPSATAESAPRVGVTFSGTRRTVLINDVIEVMGPRIPSAADSPKVARQAFLFVVGRGRTADPAAVAKIDRIRRDWEGFFLTATDGRGQAVTTLLSAP